MGWVKAILYNIGVTWARIAFTLFSRWEVEGRENVPRNGPLIVVCNHQSNADPPVVVATMPRKVIFMAKRGLFANRLCAAILTACGAYPLSRNGRDIGAIKWALKMLDKKRAVALFPESTRSPGKMRKAVLGAAYVAAKSQAPVLPIGITGTENIAGLWRVAFPFCRISVKIGEPFTVPRLYGRMDRELVAANTDLIMSRVASLLPDEYRGVYSLES